MLKPYIPANGIAGMDFEAKWCDRCRNKPISNNAKNQCIHLMRALAGGTDKWVYEGGKPICTAFRIRNKIKRPAYKGGDHPWDVKL